MKVSKVLVAVSLAASFVSATAHAASACPNDGVVRFGVEPYESSQRLLPVYTDLAKMIGDKLGCTVQLYVATSYNAEIEAMRNNKLEFGQFGPLGYVLAHQVAHAQASGGQAIEVARAARRALAERPRLVCAPQTVVLITLRMNCAQTPIQSLVTRMQSVEPLPQQ